MSVRYRDRLQEQRICREADQAEFSAFSQGLVPIENAFADDRAAGALDDFAPLDPQLEEWVERDLISESASGAVLQEVERRSSILGSVYPFDIDGNCLSARSDSNLTYIFCLAICSTRPIRRFKGEYAVLPRVFERMATEYSGLHLGDYGRAMHTGSPQDEGGPSDYKELFEQLHEETNEWIWGPYGGVLSDEDAKDLNDNGLDFVSWLEMPDRDIGALFITGQCACGEDWHTKFHDHEWSRVARWFNPAVFVSPPQRAFCVPYTLCRGYLFDASERAGLTYDRVRFTAMAARLEDKLSPELRTKMAECIELVRDQEGA